MFRRANSCTRRHGGQRGDGPGGRRSFPAGTTADSGWRCGRCASPGASRSGCRPGRCRRSGSRRYVFDRGACRIGNPYVSVPQRFRLPWPHALTSSGRTPSTPRCSGVLAPTHAASSQCVLGRPRVVRLNFVRPPEPALDRQAGRLEPAEQLPARGVDRRGVLERPLGLRQDRSPAAPGLRLQEDLDRAVALAGVARLARQGEIARRGRCRPCSCGTMCSIWSGTSVLSQYAHVRSPLLEQVLPHLVPGERALLVLDAGDLGILLFLEVEPDQLLRRRGDRAEPKEPADPGQHVGDRGSRDSAGAIPPGASGCRTGACGSASCGPDGRGGGPRGPRATP